MQNLNVASNWLPELRKKPSFLVAFIIREVEKKHVQVGRQT